MAEFFETDDVTKGFDTTISRRILSYIKPYKLITILAFIALAISTAGELLSPVIIRRAIDDALMKSWYGFSESVRGTEADKTLKVSEADPMINGRIYLRTSRLAGLSTMEKQGLIDSGVFNPTEMYVFEVNEGNSAQAALRAARPELFAIEGKWGVLPVEKLRALPAAEAAGLRAADSALIGRYVATLLAILTAILVSTFVMVYFSNLLGLKVMKDLRMQLFNHVLSRSMAYLSKQPVGRLVTMNDQRRGNHKPILHRCPFGIYKRRVHNGRRHRRSLLFRRPPGPRRDRKRPSCSHRFEYPARAFPPASSGPRFGRRRARKNTSSATATRAIRARSWIGCYWNPSLTVLSKESRSPPARSAPTREYFTSARNIPRRAANPGGD